MERPNDAGNKKKRKLQERKKLERMPDDELFIIDTTPDLDVEASTSSTKTNDNSEDPGRTAPIYVGEELPEKSRSKDNGSLWNPLEPDEYYASSDEEDSFGTGPGLSLRYYGGENKNEICQICLLKGHASRDCDHRICLACGRVDRQHDTRDCPLMMACFRCGGLGHSAQGCSKPISSGICEICSSHLHPSWKCWTHWRKYEMKPITAGPARIMDCANCGLRGHLIDDCSKLISMHPSHGKMDYSSFNNALLNLEGGRRPSRELRGHPVVPGMMNRKGLHEKRNIDTSDDYGASKPYGKRNKFGRDQRKRPLKGSNDLGSQSLDYGTSTDVSQNQQQNSPSVPEEPKKLGPQFQGSYGSVRRKMAHEDENSNASVSVTSTAEETPKPTERDLFKSLGFDKEYYTSSKKTQKKKK